MDISEIREKYNNGDYMYKMEIPLKIHDGYIFDENLSVKRNREMVAEHNRKVSDMQKEKMMKQNELFCKLTEDVVEYIVDTYNINKRQAYFIESFVYTEKHAFMSDYFSYIDEVAEMVENILKEN